MPFLPPNKHTNRVETVPAATTAECNKTIISNLQHKQQIT